MKNENEEDQKMDQSFMFEELAPNPEPMQTWIDMPEFHQLAAGHVFEVVVKFMHWEHVEQFSEIMEQTITPNTNSILYPKDGREKPSTFIWKNTKHES